MKKMILGNSGIEVSRIGFGVLPMGASQMDLTVEEGSDLIVYAAQKRITFYDTAQYYDTYRFLRPALDKIRSTPSIDEDDIVISSKCLYPDAASMRDAIEEARKALDRDVIDIFLLHEVMGMDDFEARSGAWEYLLKAREKGIIRAAGVSTHHQDVCLAMADVNECDVVFPLINKEGLGIRCGNGRGTAEEMKRSIEKCSDAGKGLYAMKVFGGGNLTGSYMECMDYVDSIDGISSMVIGFTNRDEVDRACEYAAGTIDRSYSPDISKKLMYINKEDCIGCGSCKARCPNDAIFISDDGLMEIDHDICLTCGYCAPVCPSRALIMY